LRAIAMLRVVVVVVRISRDKSCARSLSPPPPSGSGSVFCSRKASFVHVVTVYDDGNDVVIALSIAFDDVGASRSSFMGECDDSLEAKKGKKCLKRKRARRRKAHYYCSSR
jgi:hypothetical protein